MRTASGPHPSVRDLKLVVGRLELGPSPSGRKES